MINNNIKVSVIIPIYNKEKYLKQCLDSVVNQTLRNIEIILVNDGSADNSKKICEEYVAKDKRIILINQENSGAATARQKGLDIAKGEYIYFIDADDHIEPDLCERVYSEAEKTGADIVLFNCIEHKSENGKEKLVYKEKFLENGLYNRQDIIDKILPRTLSEYDNGKWTGLIRWCLWLRFFKNSLIKDNNISFISKFRRCQDLQFTFECTIHAQSYYYIGDAYLYHQNYVEDSLSKGYNKNLWKLIKPLILYLDDKCRSVDYIDMNNSMAVCALNFASMVMYEMYKHKAKGIFFLSI